MRRLPAFAIAVAVLIAVAASLAVLQARVTPALVVPVDDKAALIHGRLLYATNCASCHGRALQGQPLWQLVDQDSPRRAPALGMTGRAWARSDPDLLKVILKGEAPGAPPGRRSAMPGFEHRLTEADALAILAFVEANWPAAFRTLRARLVADGPGVSPGVLLAAWPLSAWCASPDASAGTPRPP